MFPLTENLSKPDRCMVKNQDFLTIWNLQYQKEWIFTYHDCNFCLYARKK